MYVLCIGRRHTSTSQRQKARKTYGIIALEQSLADQITSNSAATFYDRSSLTRENSIILTLFCYLTIWHKLLRIYFRFQKNQCRQNSSVKIQTEITALKGSNKIRQKALLSLLISLKACIEVLPDLFIYFLLYMILNKSNTCRYM